MEVGHSVYYDNNPVKILSAFSSFIASFLTRTTYGVQDTECTGNLHNDINISQLDSHFLS